MMKKQKKKRSEYKKALIYGWISGTFEVDDPKISKYVFRVIHGRPPKISKRMETKWNINTLHIEGLL